MAAPSPFYVKILEQPAPKALRFRYECEGRSAGSLPGATSTNDKKTYPKIQILSDVPPQMLPRSLTKGVVVVSCVTVEPPYRPHPHNLVGKEGCKKGVCTMEMSAEGNAMFCEFNNLGIQCVKKKDIEESLKVREEIRVDPFRTGFTHKSQPGSIDLNAVRLCFQVFLEGPERGQFKEPLKPVVSDPIYDKKAINDLTIMKLSECTSPVLGNKEIILLCDKVSKDDIEVRFYEEDENGGITWEAFADFQPSDVHKQYAICFRTPAYKNLEVKDPVQVHIQLRCPSKDTTSSPRPFHYTPLSSDLDCGLGQKRKRLNNQRLDSHFSSSLLLQTPPQQPPPHAQVHQPHPQAGAGPPLHSPGGSYIPPPMVPSQMHPHPSSLMFQPAPSDYFNQNFIKQEPGTTPTNPQQPMHVNNSFDMNDFANISLPNLSDVNLSLLESHLSENFTENLNISENL